MAEREVDEFIKSLEGLPAEAQQAVCWAAKNMTIIELLCRNLRMTRQELEKRIMDAQAEKDYMRLMLLLFTELYMEE